MTRHLFVAREAELAAIVDDLAHDVPPAAVYTITGEIGVGRSSLLRRLRHEARAVGATAWIDESQPDPVAVIGRIVGSLRRWVDTREIDVAREVFAFEDHRFGPLPLTPGDERAAVRRRYVDELTPRLVDALNRTVECGTVTVLLADDVGVRPEVERWLVDLVSGAYGTLHPGFVTIAAGAPSIGPGFARCPAPVRSFRLERFLPEETEELVVRRGLPAERAEDIHTASRGLPALADLLAHPWSVAPSPGRAAAADPVDHLVATLPDPQLGPAVLLGAVPRWFDRASLAVAQGELGPDALAWWRAAPGLEAPTYAMPGIRPHAAVRTAVLAHLARNEPGALTAAHERLARHHRRRATSPDAAAPALEQHRVEHGYHAVSASPDPQAAATTVLARFLRDGIDVAPVANAVVQALAERGVPDGRHEALVAALGEGDLDAASAVAARLDERDLPGDARRQLALIRWAADPAVHTDGSWWTPWSGGDGWVHGAIAAVAWHEGRYADVLASADAALDEDGRDAWVRALRGDARLRLGQADEATEDFVQAAAVRELAWVHGRLGIVALAAGRHADAVHHLTDAARLDQRDAVALALRGEAFRRMGRFGDARHDLGQAAWAEPACPWIRLALARVADAMDEPERALAHLKDAVTLAPDSPQVHVLRATTLRRLGDHQRAFSAASTALAYAEAFDDLDMAASVLVAGTGGAEHEGLYERMVLPDLGRVDALLERGLAAAELGLDDDAFADLDDAVDLAPGRADVLAARGRLRLAHRDLQGALEDLDAAVAAGAHEPWIAFAQGELCIALGDAPSAIAALDRAIVAVPGSGRAHALRGAARRVLGDTAGVVEDHTAALRLGVDEPWVHAQRGEARCALGDAGGVTDVERALALEPGSAWVRALHDRLVADGAPDGAGGRPLRAHDVGWRSGRSTAPARIEGDAVDSADAAR